MTDNGRAAAESGICRVAVAQASPVFLDRDATIAKGIELVRAAAAQGARIIAFPAVWVPGYPLWV